ncbi:hypothetical protein PY310_10400, partial [Pseudarthrobacter sp. H3Y2-7]|uniref:LGFP repeat-containing protein n=1 Tax=Pseudarthrobacter naphthalenicus TaxID=3031328 RepID=UPI003AF0A16C|nr:hypothetical protein [Pseudarthrobacter sp. H3Y2-7]
TGSRPHPGHGAGPEHTSEGPVPSPQNLSTNYPDQQFQQQLSATQNRDLGYPTSDEYSPMAGGVMQDFQFGKISWNPVTGSRITKGGIGVTWDKVGGPLSGLGYPTTDEYATANGGVTQAFQFGQIVWSPAPGPRFIKGGIGATWINVGGPEPTWIPHL